MGIYQVKANLWFRPSRAFNDDRETVISSLKFHECDECGGPLDIAEAWCLHAHCFVGGNAYCSDECIGISYARRFYESEDSNYAKVYIRRLDRRIDDEDDND